MIVREYEKIFRDDCPNFDELAAFAEAQEFLNLGWNCIQAKNFVGVIRLPSGFQLEILPKIHERDDEPKLRGLVVEMLRTLEDFAGKKFLNATLDTARLNLYEIFMQIYLVKISELVKRGLKSSYSAREENLNVFKGKLLINPHVRKNFAHGEKFFVAYDEYNIDRPEHRLIKATLAKILHTTRENFRLARRLYGDFDSVTQSTNYRRDFAKISIDRTNREYRAVMKWTEIFLRGESFTAFAGKTKATALLFDMNKLFESYVAHHVRKNFSDRFNVKTQAQEKFLFDTTKDYALKPDILLTGDETIVLDTKWKFAPTEGDMYQMFAYAKRYGAKKIFLLCPPTVAEKIYRAEDFSVTVFGVDLFDMNAAMSRLRETLTGCKICRE